jgi:hypothetical protein
MDRSAVRQREVALPLLQVDVHDGSLGQTGVDLLMLDISENACQWGRK